MRNTAQITISNIPEISAIYFALLQSGYDYYAMERKQDHISYIQKYIDADNSTPFFAKVKQNTCKVYPYWPRAALLESASIFLNKETFQWYSFNEYKDFVMSAKNIQVQDRDESFWKWVQSFPIELEKIISNDKFKQYFNWENNWIQEQERRYKDELLSLYNRLDFCIKHYDAQFKKVQIVLSAIKCVYSCDYHTHGENFIFSSGGFDIDAVLHEYLHHIVHPMVSQYAKILINKNLCFDGIDSSYYLLNDENGIVNAFEEYAVRCLTESFKGGTPPTDLAKYIEELIVNLNTPR